MKKLICSFLLIALLVPDTAAAHDDEDWNCVWIDNKKQPWGYHAGVDSFKYNAIDYDAAVLGGALGSIAGAAMVKEKVLGAALGAAAGGILGYQFDRNRKPQEPYMKCTPKY